MRTTSSHYIRLHPEAHYQKTSRSRKLSYPDIAIWQMKYSMTWFHMGNRLSWKTVVKMQLGFQKIDVFACGACQLWVANFASNSLGIEGWRSRHRSLAMSLQCQFYPIFGTHKHIICMSAMYKPVAFCSTDAGDKSLLAAVKSLNDSWDQGLVGLGMHDASLRIWSKNAWAFAAIYNISTVSLARIQIKTSVQHTTTICKK